MERSNLFEPYFTPEFFHLEKPVREAQEAIIDIDNQLNSLKERGLRFELRPPGHKSSDEAIRLRKEGLLSEKENIKSDLNLKIEEALMNCDVAVASKVREVTDVLIGDNSFRALGRQEMSAVNRSPKNFAESEAFKRKMLAREWAAAGYRAFGMSSDQQSPQEPGKE